MYICSLESLCDDAIDTSGLESGSEEQAQDEHDTDEDNDEDDDDDEVEKELIDDSDFEDMSDSEAQVGCVKVVNDVVFDFEGMDEDGKFRWGNKFW